VSSAWWIGPPQRCHAKLSCRTHGLRTAPQTDRSPEGREPSTTYAPNGADRRAYGRTRCTCGYILAVGRSPWPRRRACSEHPSLSSARRGVAAGSVPVPVPTGTQPVAPPAPMDSGSSGVGVRAGVAVPSGLPRARSGGRIPSAGLGLDASPRSVAADACGVGVIPASCANK
jgi:hypothetical protein